MNLWLHEMMKAPARSMARWLRQKAYDSRFKNCLERLRRETSRPIHTATTIDPGATPDLLWQRLKSAIPHSVNWSDRWLDRPPLVVGVREHWQKYGHVYDGIGREKALEHALTFELLDFHQVDRYCDIAAATSPISYPLTSEWGAVEAWRQDLLFHTDFAKREIGGGAQSMDVESAFFDALTLHCSLEHFVGTSDVEFVNEVDRVLSSKGACLILPLYVADTHRVFFDPTSVSTESVESYDQNGDLFAVHGYHQEHGRFHSPETLASRLLGNVPPTLNVTIIRFHDQQSVGPEIYLRFALVLHRADSVFREDPIQHSPAHN